MILDWDLIKQIIAPILAIIATKLIDRALTLRPKLVSYVGHASRFDIPPQPAREGQPGNQGGTFLTHSIVVMNAGSKACENVCVGHRVLPMHFQLYPDVPYKRNELQGGGVELVFEKLVPKEQITISYVYFLPLTWDQIHSYTKSDDGFAQILRLIPAPQPSRARWWISRALRIVGLLTVSYLVILGAARLWFYGMGS